MFQWLDSKAINRLLWDRVIEQCPWGKVYALSAYLDQLTNHSWQALIYGDYDFVMPVPFRKKWGITYVYRPEFCQQLGVFSPVTSVAPELEQSFYEQLGKRFKHIRYPLNHTSRVYPINGLYFRSRSNLVLPLEAPYANLKNQYKGDLRRNLEKAEKSLLRFEAFLAPKQAIDLYRKAWNARYYIDDATYSRFNQLIEEWIMKGKAAVYGVKNDQQLLAACIVLIDKNRIYYPFSGVSETGKKMGATAFLIDRIIQKNSGKSMLLDFEGSDLENVFYFYSKFGPVSEPYYQIEKQFKPEAWLNPWLKRCLRIIKR